MSFRLQLPGIDQAVSPEVYQPLQPELESPSPGAILQTSPQVEVSKSEISVMSPDGRVKLRIRSDYAMSEKGVVKVPFCEFEIFFEGDRKIYLVAKDLTYQVEEEFADVTGSLYGEISPYRQRFQANKLIWKRKENLVQILGANLTDPAFSVSAGSIVLDLKTNRLTIQEGVEVKF